MKRLVILTCGQMSHDLKWILFSWFRGKTRCAAVCSHNKQSVLTVVKLERSVCMITVCVCVCVCDSAVSPLRELIQRCDTKQSSQSDHLTRGGVLQSKASDWTQADW